MAVDHAAIEHLDLQLPVVGVKEPEQPGLVGTRRGDPANAGAPGAGGGVAPLAGARRVVGAIASTADG